MDTFLKLLISGKLYQIRKVGIFAYNKFALLPRHYKGLDLNLTIKKSYSNYFKNLLEILFFGPYLDSD